MVYALRPGISFCEASGRLVFLDLPRDRYFCLDDPAEISFRRAMLAGCRDREDEVLEALRRQGILERTDGPRVPCATEALQEATGTLLDRPETVRPRWGAVLRAGAAVLAARASLRRLGMALTLEALARRREAAGPVKPEAAGIEGIAAAFARLDRYLSPLDQCLPRSVALASVLARRRLPARLVIGVRLRPFLAHSWVQSRTLVVNDRPDVVRTFAPILVV